MKIDMEQIKAHKKINNEVDKALDVLKLHTDSFDYDSKYSLEGKLSREKAEKYLPMLNELYDDIKWNINYNALQDNKHGLRVVFLVDRILITKYIQGVEIRNYILIPYKKEIDMVKYINKIIAEKELGR